MNKRTFARVRGFTIFFIIVAAIAVFVIFTVLEIRQESRGVLMLWGGGITIAILILGLVVVTPILSHRFYSNYYDKLPKFTARARVISKATNTSGGRTSSTGYSVYTSEIVSEHFVSFEFNNRRENVYVDVSWYNTLVENETGVLSYKETDEEFIFIDFKRDA